MRHVLMIIFVAMVPLSGTQSSNDRDAVLKVVQIFFDTMTARDVEGRCLYHEAKCEPSPLGPLKQ